ncbi:DNA internalization-related competence protein ComEC/Rec2 [Ramlibacter sp. PS4R-6]|uniref:DNA internalization-related competence protein ComEC/Rec2 n=1 Tax=Ramlibacter sp. PS4R-6 TaxID=3133438 RepID=UPI0030A953DB
MGRGLAPALLGIVAGTALQLQQAQLWAAWAYAACAAVGVALVLTRRRPGVFLGAVFLAVALTGLRAASFQSQALPPSLEGRDIAVTGVVAAMPQRDEGGVRFRFEVEGSDARLPRLLQLGWYGPLAAEDAGTLEFTRAVPELQAGERWRFTVRLKAPHGNLNPHGFDYELWLWEQGVQATGYVRTGKGDPVPQRLGQSWLHPVERARQSVRDAILRRIEDRKTAGVIAALVTGDQNAIERADWDVFRATGVAHLMSISGLHITMFGWAASLLVGALWRRSARLCLAWPAQHAALAGGVVLAAAYAVFSGWGVPAQRTVWMLATVALLRLSGRRWPWPHVWLLACAVVVAIDPWAMLQAGFWLSFVAVGVLFATDPGGAKGKGIVHAVRASLHEQWVVTLALTPLTLLLFGQVSVVGLAANAIAIPWVTLVITPLALAGVAWNVLWDAAAGAMQVLQSLLEWLASWQLATVSWPAAPLWAGVLGVAGGLLLAMRLPWGVKVLGVPLLLPIVLWQAPRPPAGEFELVAADVGQGNALVVRTATHTLVYDAGPRYGPESDAGHRVVVPLLRAFDERVDTVVLSHRDSDHTGGAQAVLAMQPGASLLSSLEEGHELQALRPGARCVAGMRWEWDGVAFDVLHPLPADYAAAAKPNAISCVLRVGNGRRTALLAGDLEAPQEARLVAAAAPLQADVLLVPHHGSKTSSTADFLDAVKPRFALVQAGYRNRFGHPAAPVVERYRERGIAVVDSAHCGAARWASGEPDRVACQREAAARYWHHRVP